jgi:hypothetical protein
MRNLVFICFAYLLIISCNNTSQEISVEEKLKAIAIKDSIVEDIRKKANDNVFGDTVGLSKSPIKILSYKIVESEGGNYRNIRLSYKNISDKKITAIKFRWKGVDAFGEPADLGNSFAEGYGGGFTDEILRPGKSESGTWEILSRNAKKVTLAWPVEVVFEDGSKWKLNNSSSN